MPELFTHFFRELVQTSFYVYFSQRGGAGGSRVPFLHLENLRGPSALVPNVRSPSTLESVCAGTRTPPSPYASTAAPTKTQALAGASGALSTPPRPVFSSFCARTPLRTWPTFPSVPTCTHPQLPGLRHSVVRVHGRRLLSGSSPASVQPPNPPLRSVRLFQGSTSPSLFCLSV